MVKNDSHFTGNVDFPFCCPMLYFQSLMVIFMICFFFFFQVFQSIFFLRVKLVNLDVVEEVVTLRVKVLTLKLYVLVHGFVFIG